MCGVAEAPVGVTTRTVVHFGKSPAGAARVAARMSGAHCFRYSRSGHNFVVAADQSHNPNTPANDVMPTAVRRQLCMALHCWMAPAIAAPRIGAVEIPQAPPRAKVTAVQSAAASAMQSNVGKTVASIATVLLPCS